MNAPAVAFQGELGAYSEEAVRNWFSQGVNPLPCPSFDAVTQAVARGDARYGLLPIENTLAGTVVGGLDALVASDLTVVGEVIRPIRHCLLGLPEAQRGDLERALSHPVALAQCQDFFRAHPDVEPVVVYDTAGAARTVAAAKDPAAAAIAGERAAALYGLKILARDIQDRDDNQTRFLVVQRAVDRASSEEDAGHTKTAVLFETADRPGALLVVLRPLAEHGVNLTHLHSRPGLTPWTYLFFAEFEGSGTSRQVREALTEAREATSSMRILGSFTPAPRGVA